MEPTSLPIEAVLPELRAALGAHRAAVLQAPPGAGKTTRVPLALLDEPWLAGRSILILEPRRLAARAAAARMAELLGERPGERVGYRVRFDQRVSARTRVEVLTEGILTRRLQGDPELSGVGLVIFDEFHERSLHADLAFTLALESHSALRDDLRLLVMSATLDAAPVAHLLGDAPVVTSEGRAHPVVVRYLGRDPEGDPARYAAAAVERALREERGDLLLFLPGGGEIRRCMELLEGRVGETALHPLYGDLPKEAQDRAIRPDPAGRRKVVLATPIAETSLTIEGVTVVVDAGWARVPRFDPASGLTRLETQRVTLDAADQRAGRAGRLGPGLCLRLWGEGTQRGLLRKRLPEILAADLAPLLLELAQWGVSDPAALAWLDPPPAAAVEQARTLLRELEALDDQGRITPQGQAMAALPAHPRLAHLLLRGKALGLGESACRIVALLEERDILSGRDRPRDLDSRLEALARVARDGRGAARALEADGAACQRVLRAADQYRRLLGLGSGDGGGEGASPAEQGLLLAFAYPDRVAKRREGGGGRFLLANGRGARLPEGDRLAAAGLIVAAQVGVGAGVGGQAGGEGTVQLAAPLDERDLRAQLAARLERREVVRWEPREEVVAARTELRFGALVLEARPLAEGGGEAVVAAMLEGVRALGLAALPWSPELETLRARVATLRAAFPEEAWPDLSDTWLLEHLEAWLAPFLGGITRRAHLTRLDLKGALEALLGWELGRRLDREAPERLTVPSGSAIRIHYSLDEPPVLAVKLQEMFGLGETPAIAGGRLPLTLHLLSPARRPIQVTRDLHGFWERTYPEVKRELKGRYPKHPWPDDPWSATATARTKPRGT